MGYQLDRQMAEALDGAGVSEEELRGRIEQFKKVERSRYRRLWSYYRNPMQVCGVSIGEQGCDRPYRQAQEWGMPSRITGVRSGNEIGAAQRVDEVARKEVVIENDIAWRIETMVDYLFGKPVMVSSAAPDVQRRQAVGDLLRMILAYNGGVQFLQQLALLGGVYGFVDVVVKFGGSGFGVQGSGEDGAESSIAGTASGVGDLGQPLLGSDPSSDSAGGSEAMSAMESAPVVEEGSGELPAPPDDQANTGAREPSQHASLERIARMIRLEIVEPARALPILSASDYRVVKAYGQVWEESRTQKSEDRSHRSQRGWWERLFAGVSGPGSARRDTVEVLELITASQWQRYEDDVLVAEGENSLGRVPLVHIQNTAVPFEYSGQGEVEPLIPLQDELNTRLSDRANRIALQSFRMYLGKGIENFTDLPVAPGRMWMTDNEQAEVIEFGGDVGCPSEREHIAEMREAMDKTSGVSPIAAGAIKGRIGRLTSAAALRVTLLSLLAKTERKRTTYGVAIERICELALAWLDMAGVFHTSSEERRVELQWPSPLPANDLERLQEAELKTKLGVPAKIVLRELGY